MANGFAAGAGGVDVGGAVRGEDGEGGGGSPLGEMLMWVPVRGAEAVKKICWDRAWGVWVSWGR